MTGSDRGSIAIVLESLADRLSKLAPRNAEAVIGLAETVTAVIELHSNDARGPEDWTKKTPQDQIDHARAHLDRAFEPDEDGLSEASHAATRLAFLLALVPRLRA